MDKRMQKLKEKGLKISEISKKLGIKYHTVWLEFNREKNREYQREYQNNHTYRQDWIEKNRKKWNAYVKNRYKKKK